MNKEFVGTFIMTSYAIAYKTDIVTSALYGYVWSKCQLRKGFCSMSHNNIGKEMGLHKKTVGRKIKKLIELDLIKDISDTRYNFPGVTRKYIINTASMKKLIDAYSRDNLSLLNDSKDILSVSRDNLSTSKDNLSTGKDLKSLKLYKEIYKEIDKEIYTEKRHFNLVIDLKTKDEIEREEHERNLPW